ncbi:MAG: phosphopentomutase [Moritella sp.]|jgi:phosphopentomutase
MLVTRLALGWLMINQLKKTDSYLDKILDEIRQSRHDWLVLLTTDHGRQPVTGYGHGNQTKQEKTIFIGSNKPLNTEFNTVATGLDNVTLIIFMGIQRKRV